MTQNSNAKIIAIKAARWMSGTGILCGYFAGMTVMCGLAWAAKDLPSVETFWETSRPPSIQVLDRHGQHVLVKGAVDAAPVRMSELPEYVPQAILATEDKRYRHHAGVDPVALTRAVFKNFKAGGVREGGSTLAQQLAKNVFLTQERTYRRKLQEMMLALWIERSFSKDEILEKYMNRVYFGGGNWGLEAASKHYFGKPAKDVELAEAALLTALLKAPTRYNPIQNTELAETRTELVLRLMEDQELITEDERFAATDQTLDVLGPEDRDSAHYFVDWIWPDVEARIGTPAADIVIRTTLDKSIQDKALEAALQHVDSDRNAKEVAIVTIAGDGGVRAMLGGTNYTGSEFNRAVQAERQPGSAFKPFVYLTAFEAGVTPWDKRQDEPVKIGDWEPRNFTEKFKGEISVEAALALSINTVAVVLSEDVGRDRVIETAQTHGLTNLEPLRSLPLGSQTTTPLQLTSAYLPFANWGDKVEPYGIISISTATGSPLYYHQKSQPEKIVNSGNLRHINRVLKTTVERGTGRAARIPGRDVAGKTGTTNDYRDAWFVGYVPDMVTGVWVGADDNTPMKRVTGGSIPARIWKSMMIDVVKDLPKSRLPVSEPPLRARSQDQMNVLLDSISLD